MLEIITDFYRSQGRRRAANPSDVLSSDEETLVESCQSQLRTLEGIRLNQLAQFNKRRKICIPLAIVASALIIMYYAMTTTWDQNVAGLLISVVVPFFLFMMMTNGGLFCFALYPKIKYAMMYKLEVLPKLVAAFGDFEYHTRFAPRDTDISLQHDKLSRAMYSDMKDAKILPRHNAFRGDDYFCGTHKGVSIQFCEMKLSQQGDKKSRKVMEGVAILLDMKSKKFLGHTIVDKDRGRLGRWVKSKGSKLKRANLVDAEFEKIFDVYTNDQVEARYLIDPVIIERLTSLYDVFGGNDMQVSFYDEGKVLIVLKSKYNFLEPSDLHVSAFDPSSIVLMKREIEQIIAVVEHLKLYHPKDA